ncbi:MAG TPA: EcsC family protein [Ktedonobacterales bacterium]
MTSAGGQRDEEIYLNPKGGVVGKAFDAVPPEVQQMLHVKPKTPQRIQQVISWAAALDPEVLRMHQRHDKSLHTLADIRGASLHERDTVARHFARQYRHRAALTGAVTALPGGLWALVGMGADVQLTAIYAVRMAAKVAQSYGYDTSEFEEQARLADVLALAAGIDSLRGIGNWLTREGMVQLLPDLLPRVLGRLSVELTAEQAAKWVGRIIPGVSAAVGGAVDYAFLRAAGERAIAYYHNRALSDHAAITGAAYPLELPPAEDATRIVDADVAPPVKLSPAEVAAASAASARLAAAPVIEAAPSPQPPVEAASMPSPAPVAEVAAPVTPRAEALPVAPPMATPAPARPRKGRPWAAYLAIFMVFIIAASAIACVALGTIITSALQSIGH